MESFTVEVEKTNRTEITFVDWHGASFRVVTNWYRHDGVSFLGSPVTVKNKQVASLLNRKKVTPVAVLKMLGCAP